MKNRMKKLGHFTLLELLVVVAILAIIAGGLLVAYDGLQEQAAKAQASYSIASVDSAVRTFTAVEKTSPNSLDSLVATGFSAANAKTLNANPSSSASSTAALSNSGDAYLAAVPDGASAIEYVVIPESGGVYDVAAARTNLETAIGAPAGTYAGGTATWNDGTENWTYTDTHFYYDNPSGSIDTGVTPELLGNMTSKLAGKLQIINLNSAQAAALNEAGITTLRYIDIVANGEYNPANPANFAPVAFAGGRAFNSNFWIQQADIPNRVFDDATSGKNRGRGFAGSITTGVPVAVWKPGALGVDAAKVGGTAQKSGIYNSYYASVLVAFGLGNNSTMVGTDSVSGGVGNVSIAAAPVYGDTEKHEYSRYILLFDLGTAYIDRENTIGLTASEFVLDGSGQIVHPVGSASKAKLVAVVDARGDFLDEELAEASGQKQ